MNAVDSSLAGRLAPPRLRPSAVAATVALTLALSAAGALRLAQGGLRPAVVLVLGGAFATALTVLALGRFPAFVLAVLVLRATVDWTRGANAEMHPVVPGGAGAPLALFFLVAAVVWLAAQRGRPLRSPMSWALFAVSLACLASVTGSDEPIVSLAESARFWSVAAMYVVLERLFADRAGARRVLTACFASALFPLGLGLYQIATGPATSSAGFTRLVATFAHSNAYGFYLAVLLVMGVALVPHLQGLARLALLVVLGVAGAQLVLTYSRGSWITLVIGLVVVALLQSRWLFAVLLVGAIALPAAVPSIGTRLADLDDGRTVRGTGGNSLVWRMDYWRESLGLVDEQPFTGIGLKMTSRQTASGLAPHNDYVRMYVEVGLVGLAAYLALLGTLARAALLALRRARPGLDRGIAVGFAACVAGFIIVSAASNRITSVVELWYFFAFAAAAAAVSARPVQAGR